MKGLLMHFVDAMVQPTPPMAVKSASQVYTSPMASQQYLEDSKMKENKLPVSTQTLPFSGGNKKGMELHNDIKPTALEVEMARQDLMRICNPDIDRPFSSLEDACERLLPYHILAEYDVDEIDDATEAPLSASCLPLSRFQAWNETMTSKTRHFMGLFEKQLGAYNSVIRKRHDGELRGEERYILEHFLLQEEKQKLIDLKAQIEAKDKADREAADSRMKAIAQAEKARAEAQARADAQARAEAAILEAQARKDALQAELNSQLKSQEQAGPVGFQQQGAYGEANFFGWGTTDREDNCNANSESFWKGGGEHDEDDDMVIQQIESMNTLSMQDGWAESGQLDLNSGTCLLR